MWNSEQSTPERPPQLSTDARTLAVSMFSAPVSSISFMRVEAITARALAALMELTKAGYLIREASVEAG